MVLSKHKRPSLWHYIMLLLLIWKSNTILVINLILNEAYSYVCQFAHLVSFNVNECKKIDSVT